MFREVLDVGAGHGCIEEGLAVFFFRDEGQAGEFLLAISFQIKIFATSL
jgi:hypothetical protein